MVSPDLDGAPLDGAPLDGAPLDGAPLDDLDGSPLAWDPASLDGMPVDDIDGVPLGAPMDDIDGMPLDDLAHSRVALSKWERVDDAEALPQANTESKWDTVGEQYSGNNLNVSANTKEGDGKSEGDSSDDDSPSKYDSADFKSSLSSFEMSESKRSRLRELEASTHCLVKVMKFQDELETGKRPRKSRMNMQKQVEHYRNKLLQKEFDKDDQEKKERSTPKSKDRSKKEERRDKTEERRDKTEERRDKTEESSKGRGKEKSKRSEDRDRSRDRGRKDAAAIIGADDSVLPVLAEVGSSDEARLSIHLVPQGHLLVWDVPQTQLPIQRATQEVLDHLDLIKVERALEAVGCLELDRPGVGHPLIITGRRVILVVLPSICVAQGSLGLVIII
ncbi:unnamed protein product [Coregonus sp. 'balchen']|nr:unnamed protein product [Coregonus sp. 'balchen']